MQPLLLRSSNDLQAKIHRCQEKRPTSSFYQTSPNQNDTFDADMPKVQCSSSFESLVSKRTCIEKILKALVGRKLSKSGLASSSSLFEIPTSKQSDKKILHRDNRNYSMYTTLQKAWHIQPDLRRETSTLSLQPERAASMVKYSGLRKCETVLALSHFDYIEPIRPLNRLRHSFPASNFSSRYTSFLSLNTYDLRYSFLNSKKRTANSHGPSVIFNYQPKDGYIICKLCLAQVAVTTKIKECCCVFCTECLKAYVEFEISHGAYEISCPDAQCPSQGRLSLEEIKLLGTDASFLKFERYQLNHEVDVDKKRAWCPRAGCETICFIGNISPMASSLEQPFAVNLLANAIRCPTCHEEFCCACMKSFHPGLSCEENRLTIESTNNVISQQFEDGLIKNCPMCAVLIEKDDGCAQMMCKRCKHVFCWYCLSSLDDDFLLRHYDKGPCKNKLGHSRASVVWHRVQVIGIFAGFGVLLLAASPLLLLAAPCIICCKCKVCTGSSSGDDYAVNYE